jgi:hypothetical protein
VPAPESSLSVVRRVSDHHRPGPGKTQFPERQAYKAGIRLAVLDVVAAGSRLDKFIDA